MSRQEQAQKRLREKAARCWRIAHTKEDALPPGFAMTLDDLIFQLQPLRDERSLASLGDLLDAYRALADGDPGTYKPRLAQALIISIHAFGPGKALRAAEEAVAAYRELADDDAIALLPYIAEALHHQASRLARLGRIDDAERVTRDLVDICRRLTPSDSVTVLPILASALSDLGNWLWESKPEDSLASRNEAAAIYRELTGTDPARYLSRLISTLGVLAFSFKELGKHKEELATIRAGLHAYRTNYMNGTLISTAQSGNVLSSAANAAAVLSQLVQSQSTAFLLALRLWKLGQQQEALEAGQSIHSFLVPAAPARWIAALGIAHTWPIRLMARWWEERDARRARLHTRLWRGITWLLDKDMRGLHALRRLGSTQHRLAAGLQRLSDTLDTLSFRRQVDGRKADACTAAGNAVRAQEIAVGVYREMYGIFLQGDQPYLAKALDTLALRLQAAGQGEKARSAASEAAEVRRKWQAHQEPA